MANNCYQTVEKYLLSKNPLYAFSFPLSILIAIIVFGCAKAYNWSDNSYINQILIPILTFLLSMVVIDLISRQMIDKREKSTLVNKCKNWKTNYLEKYTNNIESFSNDDNETEGYTNNIESFSNDDNDNDNDNEGYANNIESFSNDDNEGYNNNLEDFSDDNANEGYNNSLEDLSDNNETEGYNNNIEDFSDDIYNEHYINNSNKLNNINKMNNLINLKNSKENKVSDLICEIPKISPLPIEYYDYSSASCIQPSNCCSLCSKPGNNNPCNLIAPIPGPQWIPETAETVQNNLKNNIPVYIIGILTLIVFLFTYFR